MRNCFLPVAALSVLLLTGCKAKQSPADAAVHFKAAQELYAAKDYPRALTEIKAAIAAKPRDGDIHFLAAQIQEGLGNQQEAVSEYAVAAAPDFNNLKAQLKFEEILIDVNQLDGAIGRINATLGSRPNNPDALALRALALQRQGSSDKARADAQAALAQTPGQANATIVMAIDALTAKNPDKALTALDAGLKVNPTSMPLLRLKAAALLMQNKKDDAVALYSDLVRRFPTDVSLRGALADLDASSGLIDDGEKVLREGVAAAPASREARMMLVGYLARFRGDAAADGELRLAIEQNPNESVYDLARAELQIRTGHNDDGAATLRTAVARVPEGPARVAAQLALARLAVTDGRVDEARKLLDDVLAVKSDDDDALILRAGLLIQAGDQARAIADLLAVAGRHPRSPQPLSLLADVYLRQGDTEKAVDALKKVIYFTPADFAPVAKLADLDLKDKKIAEAKQVVADYVKRNPTAADGRLALVRLAMQQKDWPAAQAGIDGLWRLPKPDRIATLTTAQVSEAKGEPAVAAVAYAKLNSPTKPLDADALLGYARSSVVAKQSDEAIATITALVGQKSGNEAATANIVLASLFRNAGQNIKADEALAAAVAAAPKQPAPYLETAVAAARLGQREKAIAALDAGLAAGAPQEPLLLARADLEDKQGNKDAAIASYQAILSANPRSVVAANNYASLVADAKPTDRTLLGKAREPIQRFADGSEPSVLDTLAWLDYRLGAYESAKSLLLRAKADTSKNPQLRFHYGAVLIALGDKEGGRSVVKSALGESFPGKAEAEKMLTE